MIREREIRAIRGASALATDSVEAVADWLYFHGTWPQTSHRAGDLIQSQVEAFLSIGQARHKWRLTNQKPGSPWTELERRDVLPTQGGHSFKAYLSLPPEKLCESLTPVLEKLSDSECLSFKVATQENHVSRPDSAVIYMDSAFRLNQVIGQLSRLGCSDKSRLLFAADTDLPYVFWAMDRPNMSWRRMISLQLAQILYQHTKGDPIAAAEDHMQRLGICARRWIPHDFLAADWQ